MNRPSRGNVQCIRAKTLPPVLEMPSWCVRAERRPKVLEMPLRGQRAAHRRAVVLEMPAHADLPRGTEADGGDAAFGLNEASFGADLRADYAALCCGLRYTILALMALFGHAHSTRDNDPGPATAARPWKPRKVELLSAVTRKRLLVSNGDRSDSGDVAAAPFGFPSDLARAA